MKEISKVLIIGAISFFIICQPSPLASTPLVTEMFDYTLSWVGMEVGSAKLQISCDDRGIKIFSQALANDWVSKIYRVNNVIDSTLNSEGYPIHYTLKLNQGKQTRDREVFFDHKKGLIKSIDKKKNQKNIFRMTKKCYDPLSAFYELRQRDIAVGTTEVIPIFDNEKFYQAHVEILRKERIETDYGQFETIVVHPRLEAGGFFVTKADVLIWLTNDEKKIPVKVRAKIVLGTVTAYLKGGH
jgi:hypothetical protein